MSEADKTGRTDPIADADRTLNALRASGAISEDAEARFRSVLDRKKRPTIDVNPLVQVGSNRLSELRGLVANSDDGGLISDDLEALGTAIELTQQAESRSQSTTLSSRGRGRRRALWTAVGILTLGVAGSAIAVKIQSDDPGSGTGETSQDRAMAIFEEDFLGAAAVKNTFGVVIPAETVPPIPFSQPDLERARDLGQFLILRADRASDGQPLTMQKMTQLVGPSYRTDKKGNIVQIFGGPKDNDFFTKEVPRTSFLRGRQTWALVSKEVIPELYGRNYYGQTALIASYIRNAVFKGGSRPAQYSQALQEFDDADTKGKLNFSLTDYYKNTYMFRWNTTFEEEVSSVLTNLKLNRLMRQTPVEALYDCLVYYYNNNVKLLKNTEIWTLGCTNLYGVTVTFGNASGSGVLDYSGSGYDPRGWTVREEKPSFSNHSSVLISRRS